MGAEHRMKLRTHLLIVLVLGVLTFGSAALQAAARLRWRQLAVEHVPLGLPAALAGFDPLRAGYGRRCRIEGEDRMRGRRRVGFVLAMVVFGTTLAGGVVAATQSSDEAALQPSRGAASRDVERRIDKLMKKMDLQDKLNQIQLISDGQINADPTWADKPVGGVFSLVDPEKINEYQHRAMASPLHIPILFAYDTIHGYRTIFPIPLGAASAFDPNVASQDHKFGARESAAVGLKQIYSPMVDVSHEPRWGRISEAGGEDPYLNSVYAAARVKAAQGRDYSQPDKVVTSVKHYAAYGQPEGGRDYNTTDMSGAAAARSLPAAVQGGDRRGRRHRDVLVQLDQRQTPAARTTRRRPTSSRREWGFDGFIESDYTAVAELGIHTHGIARLEASADAPRPAALNAGTDSEMVSTLIHDNGEQLLPAASSRSRGSTTPCAASCASSSAPGCSSTPTSTRRRPTPPQLRPDAVAAARKASGRSMVLLKNEGN